MRVSEEEEGCPLACPSRDDKWRPIAYSFGVPQPMRVASVEVCLVAKASTSKRAAGVGTDALSPEQLRVIEQLVAESKPVRVSLSLAI